MKNNSCKYNSTLSYRSELTWKHTAHNIDFDKFSVNMIYYFNSSGAYIQVFNEKNKRVSKIINFFSSSGRNNNLNYV